MNEYRDLFSAEEKMFKKKSDKDPIVLSLIKKYQERSQLGITKYGTTLEENNTDDFLTHLQEELMDAALYIEKLKSMRINENKLQSEI